MTEPDQRYLTDDYVSQNPTWDMEDSPWKAALVSRILRSNGLVPTSICEVGCGAGSVLAELRTAYPEAKLYGYDIAPAAARFWPRHTASNIDFQVGDFATVNKRNYDALLLLDVIEHVRDPFAFLVGLRGSARYFVLHIPLDLSAISVVREEPILEVRRRVGHIHYYTKALALSLLEESGFKVIQWEYSGAAFNAPRRTWKSKVAAAPRWLAFRLNRDLGVRALGGETLVVLAVAQDASRAAVKAKA
jgi:SAM-dependent methyltransferase